MGSVENAALSGSTSDGEEEKVSSDVAPSGDSEIDSESSSEGLSFEEDEPAPSLASSLEDGSENRGTNNETEPEVSWEAEAEALSKKFGNGDSSQQSSSAISNREVGFLGLGQGRLWKML